MLLAHNYQQQQPQFNRTSLQQLQQQQQALSSQRQQNKTLSRTQFYPQAFDPESTIDFGLDTEDHSQSISSSPNSTQSYISQYPLSTFDNIPTIAIPRGAQETDSFLNATTSQNQSFHDSPLFGATDMMHPEQWLHASGPLTPKSSSRMSHHRESSLSSLGSAGPASPYSHNTSNPQIAVTDSMSDGYNGLPSHDDSTYYQLSKTLNPSGHDNFYTGYSGYAPETTSAAAYANVLATHKPKNDRGLLAHPEFPIGQNRPSRPVSVASSIASDSPATPSMPEPEELERRRKNVFNPTIPKLDRTLTDVFSDELYNPNFSITSAPPAQTHLASVSPSNEMFQQRLQAANNQHLNTHSPVSTTDSRGRSPFIDGSQLAYGDLASMNQQQAQMRFGSAQQLRELRKAEQDAQALRNHDSGTPQTISPKDAMLDYNDAGQESNFPLFPQQNNSGFDADHMAKAINQSGAHLSGMSLDNHAFNHYMPSQSPTVQVPQQYPFIAHQRPQGSAASMSTPSLSVPSRGGSADSGIESGASPMRKPAGASADGGTYSCTYHGCTQRFETPALLQKHKREGHRQAHGLTGTRKPEPVGMTSSLLNSQAGPHRCDRINPSTGKPCNTVFSRPYDLTRHEDTIHNARKQKVRCNMCTEEKTFSRADALTRHYRVCHPDVEFPGKHRRRAQATA